MTMSFKCVAAALAVAVPFAAAAESNDAAYCQALADKYQTYVANMSYGRSPMPESPDVKIAIDQCNKGNAAAGIPVLEQKLRNARIDLPPRS